MNTLDQLTVIFWAGCDYILEEFGNQEERTKTGPACLPLGEVGRAGLPLPISRAVFLPVIHRAGKLSEDQGHIGNSS